MKKLLLAAVLAVTALGASAHWSNRVHYHNDDGSISFSTMFEPDVDVRYERDSRGRVWRVETTTTCTDTDIDRRNHLYCLDEEVTVRRFRDAVPVIRPIVERHIERIGRNRIVIVTTTRTCIEPRWNRNRVAVCDRWRVDVTREVIRRDRRNQFDLDDDGRTEPWERLLFRQFRSIIRDLDNG